MNPAGLLLLSLVVGACGDSPPTTSAAPAKPAAQGVPAAAPAAAPAGATGMTGMPAVREITADEFDRYLGAVKDVRAMGQSAQVAGDADQMETMFQGMQNVAEFKEVLGKHGFDMPGFMTVHSNAVWAYGAVMMDEQQVDWDKAKAEQDAALEAMKGQMSDEQIAAMKQQLEQGNKQLEAMRDVPPANKQLLIEHRAEFEQVVGKE